MNLWEGNIVARFGLDNVHGSSSFHTAFRCHSTGKATNPDNPGGVTNGRVIGMAAKTSLYSNFIGNVIGDPDTSGWTFETYENGPCDSVIWARGNQGDNSGPTWSTDPATTMLKEGSYTYVQGETEWSDGPLALPDSLYLTEEPSWWGDEPWPPVGSDLTPMVSNNPAKTRYEEM